MNQVGIGKIKGVKIDSSPEESTVKLSKIRRAHPNPLNKTKGSPAQDQEGQLAVDILQSDEEMLIVCPIAGVEKAELSVAIQDDVLTIRGERKRLKKLEGKAALVRELYWGTFSRSIVLPDHIDRKNIKAQVLEHILVISIPKIEDFKTRIIHINDAS